MGHCWTAYLSKGLVEAGLDLLWVSLDGANPESYADVRLGAALPQIIKNVESFHALRRTIDNAKPEIEDRLCSNAAEYRRAACGFAPVYPLASIARISISNVLPYTEELCGQVLYSRILGEIRNIPSPWVPSIDLPKIDGDQITRDALGIISGAAVTT